MSGFGRRCVLLSAALALAHCGGGSSPAPTAPLPVTSLQIVGLPPEPLTVGQSVRLTAIATTMAGASDVTGNTTWRAWNPGVAVVSTFGVLVATGVGEADIQASYQGTFVTIRPRVEPATTIDDRFKVAVLAMDSRGNPAMSDVERVFARAAAIFRAKTGGSLGLIDFRAVPPGSPFDQVRSYVTNLEPGRPMPDGVLALSNDATAVNFGGWSQVFALPPPAVNTFPSPYHPADRAYLAVQNFSHIYSRCGYDAQGTRIGERSANGECRGQSGVMCVNNGRNWVCPDTLNDLYAEDDYYAACTIVHELVHPFGPLGNADHYGTPECTARTGMSASHASDRRLVQESCAMCPDVYANARRR